MAYTEDQISQLSEALASCDTVDGYSLVGVAGEGTVDVNGEPVDGGVETIDFYDADGEYLYSCEKEGPDGWAELGVAGEETVDINGDPIAPGTEVIDFYDADGEYIASCEKATADGYAVQGIADETTVDAEGNPILPGAPVINFYDADGNYIDSCLKEGPDGYAEQGVADADTVDSAGDPIPAGTSVINFYDANGDYVNSCAKAGPDGYSEQSVSVETTVDANGDPIDPGQDVIDFYDANGVYVNSCLKSGPDGYAEQDVADADSVDLQGNPIAPGTEVINFYDENGDYVNSCAKSPAIQDCDGNARDSSPLRLITVPEAEAFGFRYPIDFVDSGDDCTPADPTGWLATQKLSTCHRGLTWHWDGDGWVCHSVTAGDEGACGFSSPVNIWDAGQGGDFDFQDLAGAGAVLVNSVSATYTNENCYPMSINASVRSAYAGQSRGYSTWSMSSNSGPNHNPSSGPAIDLCQSGIIAFTHDTGVAAAGTTPLQRFNTSGLFKEYRYKLLPGDTATIEEDFFLNVTQYNPSPANVAQIGTLTVFITATPCKPDA